MLIDSLDQLALFVGVEARRIDGQLAPHMFQ
jgi:hypothetical protein